MQDKARDTVLDRSQDRAKGRAGICAAAVSRADRARPGGDGHWSLDGHMASPYSHANWVARIAGRTVAVHGDEGLGAHLRVVDVDPTSDTFMAPIASSGSGLARRNRRTSCIGADGATASLPSRAMCTSFAMFAFLRARIVRSS